MNLLRSALPAATTGTFLVPDAPAAPQSAPAKVLWLNFSVDQELPLPDGFVSLESVIDDVERDEAGKTAMAEARQWVGQSFYAGEAPRLAAYRLAKGWSQKRLAEELGTSQSYVARLESGRSDPQMSTVRRVCSALGITVEQFAQGLETAISR